MTTVEVEVEFKSKLQRSEWAGTHFIGIALKMQMILFLQLKHKSLMKNISLLQLPQRRKLHVTNLSFHLEKSLMC